MEIRTYIPDEQDKIVGFLDKAFRESGKALDLAGRHAFYNNISVYFEAFWGLYDEGVLIGTVGIKELDKQHCELKSLYLSKEYQGKGLGYQLVITAIAYARTAGYQAIYLDTMSSYERAIRLYERSGFRVTERYNDNPMADVFMVYKL